MSGEYDTDVLVVGIRANRRYLRAGPGHLRGAGARVATKWNWLANSPRAHITNQRAMEVLRDLGVEDEATAVATPWNLMGDTMFTTSLAGDEVARLRTWGTGENRLGDYLQGSPCPLLDIPQPYMEPVLVKNAAARGADDHVQHRIPQPRPRRQRRHLHPARPAQRPPVHRARPVPGRRRRRPLRDRRGIGLPIEGAMGRAGTIYTLFKADLTRYVAHRPSILHWIMTPGAGFGEIGMGTFRVIRPWDQWIAGWGYDIRRPRARPAPRSGPAPHPGDDRRPGRRGRDRERHHLADQPGLGHPVRPGPGLLRRRRRAPAPALQRARLEHLHPGRVQPRLETRLRRQGLGRTRPAGVLLRRTRPGRRPGRRPRQPVPRRLRPGQRRLPHRRPGRPGRRGPGQAPRPRPRTASRPAKPSSPPSSTRTPSSTPRAPNSTSATNPAP